MVGWIMESFSPMRVSLIEEQRCRNLFKNF